MKFIRDFWTDSPPEHKDYLFIYAWGAIWALVYLIFPPASTLTVFSTSLVYLWCVVTMIGGGLGVYGLFTRNNLLYERLGVTLLMLGPIAFALTQLGLALFGIVAVLGDPLARIHLIFFALWPLLFLNKRRRQLKARTNLVKKIPLPDENTTN
ncbi:membrane protein [Microbacterium phage Cece]|nr:membrane protein [Microbacterium phage Cece]